MVTRDTREAREREKAFHRNLYWLMDERAWLSHSRSRMLARDESDEDAGVEVGTGTYVERVLADHRCAENEVLRLVDLCVYCHKWGQDQPDVESEYYTNVKTWKLLVQRRPTPEPTGILGSWPDDPAPER